MTGQAVSANSIVVLADCHIHPGHGIDWPAAALAAIAGAELIVTLGDMGEGLDSLAAIAPLIGVRGADDVDDERAAEKTRVLEVGPLRIGCVFDPAELVATASPMTLSDEAVADAFGGPIDVLLWASTHVPSISHDGERLLVNPGSATLPAEGAVASFARLRLGDGPPQAEIVTL